MKPTSAVELSSPHPGDRTQVLDGGKLLADRLQLPLDLLDPSFDLADLATGLGEDGSQGLGQIGVGVLDERPRRGHHFARADGDEYAELAQQPA